MTVVLPHDTAPRSAVNKALVAVVWLFSVGGFVGMAWGIDTERVVFAAQWIQNMGIALGGFGGLLVLVINAWLLTATFPRHWVQGAFAFIGKIVSLGISFVAVGTLNGIVVYGITEMAMLAGGVGMYLLLYTALVPNKMRKAVVAGSSTLERAIGILFGVPLLLWAVVLAQGGWSVVVNEGIYNSLVDVGLYTASFIAAATSTTFALLHPTLQWYQDYIDAERKEAKRNT